MIRSSLFLVIVLITLPSALVSMLALMTCSNAALLNVRGVVTQRKVLLSANKVLGVMQKNLTAKRKNLFVV
jgi:hypothetical protein